MKLQRLVRDFVHVKVDKPKEQTDTGFYIPTSDRDGWKSLPPTGVVLMVGPWVRDWQVGDRVLFSRYASIILDDEDERICLDRHIMAKLDE